MFVEALGGNRAKLDLLGKRLEVRRNALPVIKSCLQCGRDVACRSTAGEIARDDDKLSVAPGLQRGKFHGRELSPNRDVGKPGHPNLGVL